MLNVEEATELYKNKSNEEYFSDVITYVTSGPCRVLILTKGETGEGVLELWRDMIGPFDAAVAKTEFPESLRSVYGENVIRNALHASISHEEAERELRFFYPDYELPTFVQKRQIVRKIEMAPQVEKTLALIKPGAFEQHREVIVQAIEQAGIKIVAQKVRSMMKREAQALYSEHKEESYFPQLIKETTCGALLILCLGGDGVVKKWKELIGPMKVVEALESAPESLCARFQVRNNRMNSFHGSETIEDAQVELRQFFKRDEIVWDRAPELVVEETIVQEEEPVEEQAASDTNIEKKKSGKKKKTSQRSGRKKKSGKKKKRSGKKKRNLSSRSAESTSASGEETSDKNAESDTDKTEASTEVVGSGITTGDAGEAEVKSDEVQKAETNTEEKEDGKDDEEETGTDKKKSSDVIEEKKSNEIEDGEEKIDENTERLSGKNKEEKKSNPDLSDVNENLKQTESLEEQDTNLEDKKFEENDAETRAPDDNIDAQDSQGLESIEMKKDTDEDLAKPPTTQNSAELGEPVEESYSTDFDEEEKIAGSTADSVQN